MRTAVRKIGNSRGVLIPAALLAECGIVNEVELRRDGARIVIESVRPTREGWFDGYRADEHEDAWQDLPIDADHAEWEW